MRSPVPLFLCISLGGLPVQSPQADAPLPVVRTTQVRLRDALIDLLERWHISYGLDGSLCAGDTPLVKRAGDGPFRVEFEGLLRSARTGDRAWTYRKEGDVYNISLRSEYAPVKVLAPAPRRTEEIDTKISLSKERIPLREAMEAALEQSGLDYLLLTSREMPEPIRVDLRAQPLDEALGVMTDAAGVRKEMRLFEVGGLFISTFGAAEREKQETARISLRAKRIGLRDALSALFHAAGVNHKIEAGVPNTLLTAHLYNVPFRTALETLLRTSYSAGVAPTYRVEGGAYTIVPQVILHEDK